MTTLLFIGSILSFLFGLLIFVAAKGGIHEATGAVFMVISAILFTGGAAHRGINLVIEMLGTINITLDMLRKHHVPTPPAVHANAIQKESAAPEVATKPSPPPAAPSWVDDARAQLEKDRAREAK